MLRLENIPKGTWLWANHPSYVWQPARIIEQHKNHLKVEYFNASEGIVQNQETFCQIPSIQCFEDDLNNSEIYNDLSAMSTLSTPSVLYFLHKAYSSGIYYSKIGSGTVLAINPFQYVDDLFTDKIIDHYNSATLSELAALPAHIFGIAETAFRGMQSGMGDSNQSIIISGESGAGKTWTVRCLMRYFATVGASTNLSESIVGDEIEHRVLCSNPILEAFGNASTPRNHNSSRFGKYIQLQYNRSGCLVGACLQVYLLEKTRVASQGGEEQAYHIFYQMLNGASEKEAKEWRLPATSSIRQANGNANNNNIRNKRELDMDDYSAFGQTKQSMLSVGISAAAQNSIFKFLSAILHLLDVKFEGADDLSTPCDIVSPHDNVKHASKLLEVPINNLVQAITIREIEAGRKRKSVFRRPCTRAECAARRDALIKSLYENIFLWLVENIGNDLSADAGSIHSFIGLLDVYGFESFANNGLEQLCINYANEKLQQYYVTNFLKAQQEELVAEGVTWRGLSLDQLTNTCLTQLESPRQSVFALFNEECRLNRGSTANQLKDRLTEQFGKSSHITQPRILTPVPSFSVAHYAGPVVYTIENLIPNNKDEVPAEIVALFLGSTNPLCVELFRKLQTQECNAQRGKQHETVLIQFKKSLDNLLMTLSSTKCHYIRCIKPNKKSLPLLFDAFHVVDQLRSCGIVETISICGKLYPHQISFDNFVSHFSFFARNRFQRNDEVSKIDCCRNILNLVSVEYPKMQDCWKMGKSKVFISASFFEFLEKERDAEREKCCQLIQRTWKFYLRRKNCRRDRKVTVMKRNGAATNIQNQWRRVLNVRRCRKLIRLEGIGRRRAARTIQRHWKSYVSRIVDAKLLMKALPVKNTKLHSAVLHTKIPRTVLNDAAQQNTVTDAIYNIEVSKQNHLSLSLLASMIDPMRLATYFIKPFYLIRYCGAKPFFLRANNNMVLTSKYSKMYFIAKQSDEIKNYILPYAHVKPRNGTHSF